MTSTKKRRRSVASSRHAPGWDLLAYVGQALWIHFRISAALPRTTANPNPSVISAGRCGMVSVRPMSGGHSWHKQDEMRRSK